MAGGLAEGHLKCDAFLELIRVVKPGTHSIIEHVLCFSRVAEGTYLEVGYVYEMF